MPMAGCHKPRGKYIVTGDREHQNGKDAVSPIKGLHEGTEYDGQGGHNIDLGIGNQASLISNQHEQSDNQGSEQEGNEQDGVIHDGVAEDDRLVDTHDSRHQGSLGHGADPLGFALRPMTHRGRVLPVPPIM